MDVRSQLRLWQICMHMMSLKSVAGKIIIHLARRSQREKSYVFLCRRGCVSKKALFLEESEMKNWLRVWIRNTGKKTGRRRFMDFWAFRLDIRHLLRSAAGNFLIQHIQNMQLNVHRSAHWRKREFAHSLRRQAVRYFSWKIWKYLWIRMHSFRCSSWIV